MHTSIAQNLARALIAAYRLTLSWAGGWMTLARLSRCHPLGTSGLDFVTGALPANSRWYLPWRYGRWRGVNNCPQPRDG